MHITFPYQWPTLSSTSVYSDVYVVSVFVGCEQVIPANGGSAELPFPELVTHYGGFVCVDCGFLSSGRLTFSVWTHTHTRENRISEQTWSRDVLGYVYFQKSQVHLGLPGFRLSLTVQPLDGDGYDDRWTCVRVVPLVGLMTEWFTYCRWLRKSLKVSLFADRVDASLEKLIVAHTSEIDYLID